VGHGELDGIEKEGSQLVVLKAEEQKKGGGEGR